MRLKQLQAPSYKQIHSVIQYSIRIFAVVAFLLTTAGAPAQPLPSKDSGKDQLRFTLVFSRHGIRSPLIAASTLNLYSSDPWPEWGVPLGYLTPHGALVLHQMGAYMRREFARNGLLPASGCPKSSEIYLYSDTDERNISSTRSTFAGLEPGCDPLPINTIVPEPGVEDPLFSAVPLTFPPPPQKAAEADSQAAIGSDPTTFFSSAGNPELEELAHILAPDPGHPAAEPILDDPRPLVEAWRLVEDILLEYVDGKPMSEVGWGRVDEPTLCRLIPLYIKQLALTARTPLSARTQASNLMAHILETLEQAAQSSHPKSIRGAIGPVGTRMVYVSGHDYNLSSIGGLLGLHWTADGRTDDTPPDAQILFELWQNSKSKEYTVRLRYRAQTINQLRSGEVLTLENPPAEDYLTPPGCHANQSCPFTSFDHAVHSLLRETDLMPTHIVYPSH